MDAEQIRAEFESALPKLRFLATRATPEAAGRMIRDLTREVLRPLQVREKLKLVGKETETVVQSSATG